MEEYYEKIRELREDRNLKQSDIAKLLGTTQQVYSRYEKGINEMPIRHIITLCKFYNVSADYILGINKKYCCPYLTTLLSGSPVLQNGRLIGAITYVLVDDPTTGYILIIQY